MVIKGSARGGARDIARHLQRTDTNDRVEVLDIRGTAAEDLRGALYEMEAVGSGAQTAKAFYHAQINPKPSEAAMTPAQRDRAIEALEKELGLEGQARAVVEHEKHGRAHWHVVWSRIDLERMAGISDSHNFRKHEIVARQLEKEFGHERVQGAHVEREGVERPQRTPSHAEMQQAERSGLSPAEAKTQLTKIWRQTDTGKAFAAALEDRGWILARGDKRDFVVIDPAGETHSLARRIDGAKAADVRGRMGDVDREALPTVDQAKDIQNDRNQGVTPAHDIVKWEDRLAAAAIEKAKGEASQAPGAPAAQKEPERVADDPPAPAARGRGQGGDSILSVAIDMLDTLITESRYIVSETAKEGRFIAGELAHEGVKLGAFVAAELDRRPPEPPRRAITEAEFDNDPAARRAHYARQIAAHDRSEALDHLSVAIKERRSLDANDLRKLNRADLEAIRSGGDDALHAAIAAREKELDRDAGRERER